MVTAKDSNEDIINGLNMMMLNGTIGDAEQRDRRLRVGARRKGGQRGQGEQGLFHESNLRCGTRQHLPRDERAIGLG